MLHQNGVLPEVPVEVVLVFAVLLVLTKGPKDVLGPQRRGAQHRFEPAAVVDASLFVDQSPKEKLQLR